ncbi:MAG: tetratricopeptide repeat protein [Thermodesulfobacteriota bacterium]|nr:tetratricopeptide repeat protein [Thermodesulfobacteriota bacterium]
MKTICCILLSLFIAFPLYAQNYNFFIEKADKYYEIFENIQALQYYEKAYAICPDNYEVLLKLARTCNDIGEDLNSKSSKEYYVKAVGYAKPLQEKYPDKAESHYYLAVSQGNLALFKGGREKVKLSRKIEKNAKKAIEIDPEFFGPYIVLGMYYREVANSNWFSKSFAKTFFGGLPDGTNRDSERMLLKAIELDPRNIYARHELAKTYIKMGRKDQAIQYLKEVIELPRYDHQDLQKKAEAKVILKKLMKSK